MKNIIFLSENFQFLEVKFSIYLNKRVFVMACPFRVGLGFFQGRSSLDGPSLPCKCCACYTVCSTE